jgi:hypothetical protein
MEGPTTPWLIFGLWGPTERTPVLYIIEGVSSGCDLDGDNSRICLFILFYFIILIYDVRCTKIKSWTYFKDEYDSDIKNSYWKKNNLYTEIIKIFFLVCIINIELSVK